MKKKICGSLMLAMLFLSSCKKDYNDALTTISKSVGPYSSILVQNGFEVVIADGNSPEVTIEAPGSLQPHIITAVQNGTLMVKLDDEAARNNTSSIVKKLTLTNNSLSKVETSGGAKLRTTGTLSATPFQFVSSGGGESNIRYSGQSASFTTSGGGSLTVDGATQEMNVDISGGGKLYAFGFTSGTATVVASGGSQLEVRASVQLNVTASGASIVRYKGTPGITTSLTGGSQLVNAN